MRSKTGRIQRILGLFLTLGVMLWFFFDREARFETSIKEPMREIIATIAPSAEEKGYLLNQFDRVHPACYSKHSRSAGRGQAPTFDDKLYFRAVLDELARTAQADGRLLLADRVLEISAISAWLLD